ncbi:MAG TPA: UDP-N-acetylmuramoyl-L-alanyl-D-glutamate--2,6-diaminopimelate ligase, partial [Kofleriaceae bacterium]|nr:UDP-N-acetylmuramoyl-L-alanyl-D-glutamate--2,6-diaminopimelate ligase [Kofleriaceae bacterium]
MNARDLIAHLEPVDARAVGDLGGGEITGVSDDSRTVAPGHVFVAVPGMTVDGHDFIADAAARGAVLAVVERPSQSAIPEIVVTSAARALGLLAAAMARNPADRLTMIGITGTNGKTTTTYLVEAILAAAGHHPAVLGTVGYRWGGREHPAPYTTPTPIVLHAALADAAAAGSTHAILEVSSAALAMDRMAGVTFDVAAFSNLTQDHLDLHGTMAQYQAAKERLFSDHLRASACAAINIDDPAAGAMARAAAPARILRVSTSADADITARAERSTIDGIACTVTTPSGGFSVESAALIGHYNLANIALAVAIAEALAIPHAAIAAGISAMAGVPGRVERVANDAGLDILVDYAHTPDALANVLDAVRPLTRRRLICVFGCGGDRDPGKRPKMGAAVAERADVCVVTSDNPRTEDPQAILDMILPAVPQPFFVDVDRRTAIRAAIFEAVPGDIVVIAGKGHEDYQILGTDKIHFDDREQAAEAAAARMTM